MPRMKINENRRKKEKEKKEKAKVDFNKKGNTQEKLNVIAEYLGLKNDE